MCPIIAERLQLSDRRFLLWFDFVSLDVQSLLTCDYLAPFSPMGPRVSSTLTFGTLPMFQSGHIIIEEASSVLDYREWAAYLANRNS